MLSPRTGGRSAYGSKLDHLSAPWIVRPHGELERLADNLWWTWGSLPGMRLKRSMVVARRRDGDLVIHNAIALDHLGMLELEAIGEPRYLVVPSAADRLDAPAFKQRYPRLQVFAPRGGRDAIARVMPVDGIYEDFPADDHVRLEMLHGVGDAEGALFVESRDGVTIVLSDAVMSEDRRRSPLGLVLTTLLASAHSPRVSRLAKLHFMRDKRALGADLERFAQHPDLVRVIAANGKIATSPDAAIALRRAAASL